MEINCELVFEYRNRKEAENVLKSVELDNEGFVQAKVVGNKIISKIKAKTLPSLQHTLDDYLACIAVAEKVISRS